MFIDTNVLVSSRVPGAPHYDVARSALQEASRGDQPLRISRQVVREYLATVTRPQSWKVAITREEALSDAEWLVANFDVLEDSAQVTDTLISLCREVSVSGRQIHDANIVATMLAHGERRLLTFNATDFRRYGDRIELVSS